MGLGVPLAFSLLSVLANQSEFIIASTGSGKTKIIESICENCIKLPNSKIDDWASMAYYQLIERIGVIHNKNLIWTVQEWSNLSEYHRETLLSIASRVSTDHKFERTYQKGTGGVGLISIMNCNLVMLIAIQPVKYTKLMTQSENWNSLAEDRFTKFPLINPMRISEVDTIPKFTIPADLFVLEYHKPQGKSNVISKMLRNHMSDTRAKLSSARFAESWCWINGIERFTDVEEMQFYSMFNTYLEMYPSLIRGYDPDRDASFYTGAFRTLEFMLEKPNFDKGYVEVNDLVKHFKMESPDMANSQATIYRHLQLLKHKGLVKNNSPTWSLSKDIQSFFERYKEMWT
jgi:hypothetical protein